MLERQLNIDQFGLNILGIIEKMSYDFYLIKPNARVQCKCVDYATKQADPACPLCLGTGCKIIIKVIHGASVDTNIASTANQSGNTVIARNYYVKMSCDIGYDDIIVDDGEVYYVYSIKNEDRKSTRLNSSHSRASRMPSSA